MIYQRLVNDIIFEEGTRNLPYLDTEGVWTIGIGFTSVDGVKVTEHTPPLTAVQSCQCLNEHIFNSVNIAMKFVKNFSELSDRRQEVLVNMAYQLGNRLLQFNNTRVYIEYNRHEMASDEMLNSLWATQTPARAKRMSKRFRRG